MIITVEHKKTSLAISVKIENKSKEIFQHPRFFFTLFVALKWYTGTFLKENIAVTD